MNKLIDTYYRLKYSYFFKGRSGLRDALVEVVSECLRRDRGNRHKWWIASALKAGIYHHRQEQLWRNF